MSDLPGRVDAVTNDPARIEQRKDIEPGMTVPRSTTKGKTTMTGEVQCGFLTYHPPMPHFPTIVRYKGQWMPEALITHGDHKRFTDAELAAEFEAARCDAMVARANRTGTYWAPLGDTWSNNIYDAQERALALLTFAMAPHFDE